MSKFDITHKWSSRDNRYKKVKVKLRKIKLNFMAQDYVKNATSKKKMNKF